MNTTFSADALWGHRYILPPDRILDARGNDITGLVPSGSITRVIGDAARWSPGSGLSADAAPVPTLIGGLGSLIAAASTRFSIPWTGASALDADGSVATP